MNVAVRRVAPALILLVALVAVWELAVSLGFVNRIILPAPSSIVVEFVGLIASGLIWEHLWATFFESVVGFLVGSTLGFVVAVGAALFIVVRTAVYPYVIALQVTPLIAVAPLIVAWLGFGYSTKIAMSALICFFPVFVTTLAGILSVSSEERDMFRSLGASRSQTFLRLQLPRALPQVFAGLKTSMTLALIGAVVGEFVAGQSGLGILVQRFSSQLAVADAFAVVLILTLLGLALFGTMALLERWLVYWVHDERLTARTARRFVHDNGTS